MYDVKRLQGLASTGLKTMARAVLKFGHEPGTYRIFQRAWGFWPWAGLFAAAVLAGLGGEWIEVRWPDHRLAERVYWPLVLFAMIAAWRVRSVLYDGYAAEIDERGVAEDRLLARFNGLAVPLVAGGIQVLLVAAIVRLRRAEDLSWPETWPEQVLAAVSAGDRLLGLAAAMAIGVASLSFRKEWVKAGIDFATRLFVFGILVGVTIMVLEAIRPFGSVSAFVYEFFVADQLPATVRRVIDGTGNAGVTSIIYLGLLGGIWTVAQRNFGKLLDSGDVDLLQALDEEVHGKKDSEAKDPTASVEIPPVPEVKVQIAAGTPKNGLFLDFSYSGTQNQGPDASDERSSKD